MVRARSATVHASSGLLCSGNTAWAIAAIPQRAWVDQPGLLRTDEVAAQRLREEDVGQLGEHRGTRPAAGGLLAQQVGQRLQPPVQPAGAGVQPQDRRQKGPSTAGSGASAVIHQP
jgi:hypothetical protein